MPMPTPSRRMRRVVQVVSASEPSVVHPSPSARAVSAGRREQEWVDVAEGDVRLPEPDQRRRAAARAARPWAARPTDRAAARRGAGLGGPLSPIASLSDGVRPASEQPAQPLAHRRPGPLGPRTSTSAITVDGVFRRARRRGRRAMSASSIEWVTNRNVTPASRTIRFSSAWSRCRVIASSGAERLVHQQDLGLERERARDRDALLHAAGELVGVAIRGRLETGQLEEPSGRPPPHRRAEPVHPQRVGDVAEDRPPREELVELLEDDARDPDPGARRVRGRRSAIVPAAGRRSLRPP